MSFTLFKTKSKTLWSGSEAFVVIVSNDKPNKIKQQEGFLILFSIIENFAVLTKISLKLEQIASAKIAVIKTFQKKVYDTIERYNWLDKKTNRWENYAIKLS